MATTEMAQYASPAKGGNNLLDYGRNRRNDAIGSPEQFKPRLERSSESMPRLNAYNSQHDDTMSRRSGLSGLNNKLNQSMEMLRPLKKENSMMKVAGTSIMGNMANHRLSSNTIDYGINRDDSRMANTQKADPYANISVQDMRQREAKAQFDGVCVKYNTPDTRAKLYKIHGQVDMSLNKKPKSTYLSEIIDKAKSPKGKIPGPTDYSDEKAFDFATQHNTKKHQWPKSKRTSIIDDIQAREKTMKGPADYSNTRKNKILGNYTLKTVTGQLMNETEFMSKQSPASNHYKLNYSTASNNHRIPQAHMNRDKSPKAPLIPYKRTDAPSPTSYKDVDKNWKKLATYRNTSNHNYTIKKEAKSSFLDQTLKLKSKVPQVGHYQDSMERFCKLSRGTSMPRYKQGR